MHMCAHADPFHPQIGTEALLFSDLPQKTCNIPRFFVCCYYGKIRSKGSCTVNSRLTEKKNSTKSRILKYMFIHGNTSKAELSKALNLSMPTVLTNTSELITRGIVDEKGELESTGGRRARQIGLCAEHAYSVGVNVTANAVSMVLVNLCGEVVCKEKCNLQFSPGVAYCSQLGAQVTAFCAQTGIADKILGVGIAIPGIVDHDRRLLEKSHVLWVENYSLKMIEQSISFPVYFANDANAAMLSENPAILKNGVYLSLNHTLGGAICMDGMLFLGEQKKAGEFGHMLLVPGGKRCYCGKNGCADAYCAASVLTDNGKIPLDDFMRRIGSDPACTEKWNSYLEHLAILVSNIRMAFDGDIILGGDVGGYLSAHTVELGERVMQYNLFDRDQSYLKNCTYKKEAAAIGVALQFFWSFMEQF